MAANRALDMGDDASGSGEAQGEPPESADEPWAFSVAAEPDSLASFAKALFGRLRDNDRCDHSATEAFVSRCRLAVLDWMATGQVDAINGFREQMAAAILGSAQDPWFLRDLEGERRLVAELA